MAEYRLQSNEAIILKSKSVSHGFWGAYTDEILLTNINFVWTSIGIMGFPKKVYQYPLSQIKKHNGKFQVLQGEHSGNGSPMLDVYLANGSVEQFGFQISEKAAKKEIQKWIQAFNGTIKGDSDYDEYEDNDFDNEDEEDDDSILGAFREVGNELKGIIGIKSKKQTQQQPKQQKAVSEKVALKCASCGAPLSGVKGRIVRCRYCDSDQKL